MAGAPHVLLIDNYDSFTYNVAQALGICGARVTTIRNDSREVHELDRLEPDRLVISPGPGGPEASAVSRDALRAFRGRIPVLGVCLGHQVLAEALGGTVEPAPVPVHGKAQEIHHADVGIFAGLPDPFLAARYHSLIVRRGSVPGVARVVAWTHDGLVMGLGLPGEATWGVQFHPESFLTPDGGRLLARFLEGCPCPAEVSVPHDDG